MNRTSILLVAVWLGVASPDRALHAQGSCRYDQCALAFRQSFWSRYLVRGDSGVAVARIGFVAPALPTFVARQDSVGSYFREFRAAHTSGNWFVVLGAIVMAAGTTWVYAGNYESVGVGLSALGVAGLFIGSQRLRRSENALHRGIWLYNRELAR